MIKLRIKNCISEIHSSSLKQNDENAPQNERSLVRMVREYYANVC